MSLVNTINEKFCIAAYERYKAKRYGITSCKITVDEFYLMDIRDIYNRHLEQVDCGDTLTCRCSITKIEEIIKTI